MVAFANAEGGRILIGVADDGSATGLAAPDVRRINSREELRRFFQFSPQFHADEMPTRAGAAALDRLRFRDFLKREYGRDYPDSPGVPEVPKEVFEELLVNALVHRDYMVSAAIRLLVYDNRIEIISPGHLPNNLTVEKIQAGNSNIRNPILMSFAAKKILPYHGLGSGIKRALERWPNIDFHDDRDGCLFVATVWRRGAKEAVKEKAWSAQPGVASGEVSEVGDKTGAYGVNHERNGTISGGHGTKNEQGILLACREKRSVTVDELTARLGVSVRTVKRVLASLQGQGRLRRVGGRKFGYWEVCT